MKSIITKKQFYDSPVIQVESIPIDTAVLAGSPNGLVKQQDNNKYKETNLQDYPTVGSRDVLAKPHSFFWEMSEDE